MTPHRAFFGDGERDFRITPKLIRELEQATGAGIGALCRRLFAGDFTHADVTETIRLGLIGGGETPERAAALVATYAQDRPLGESYPLAVSILEALWFGAPQTEKTQ
jgi:hypothetical protein